MYCPEIEEIKDFSPIFVNITPSPLFFPLKYFVEN